MKFNLLKPKKSSELTEEVLKEVLFMLEEKVFKEANIETNQKNSSNKNRWEDIESLKDFIESVLEPKMEEFEISEFRDGKAKRDLVIVYKTPKARLEHYRDVFNYLASLTDSSGRYFISNIADHFGNSSIPYTQLNFSYSFKRQGEEIEVIKPIMLVHKFVHKNAWGLAQENILAYVLDPAQDPKQMVKLKKRLGEPINKTGLEIEQLLNSPDWSPMYEMAKKAKTVIEKEFGVGNISSAEAVGGVGGKEDIELKLNKPWKDTTTGNEYSEIHLSSKLGLTGKNPFIANIDLGDGITTTGTFPLKEQVGAASEGAERAIGINLIPNPDRKPWWQTVRTNLSDEYLLKIEQEKNQILNSQEKDNNKNKRLEELEQLKQEIIDYKSKMTMIPPKFLFDFRLKYADSYKRIIKFFNDKMIEIFIQQLKNLSIDQLAAFVRYAFFGMRNEKSPPLFKITMTSANTTLEKVNDPKFNRDAKNPITVNKSQIIINIPGLNPMIISGIKFRNNVLSSRKSDLNIKTRA